MTNIEFKLNKIFIESIRPGHVYKLNLYQKHVNDSTYYFEKYPTESSNYSIKLAHNELLMAIRPLISEEIPDIPNSGYLFIWRDSYLVVESVDREYLELVLK
jgi:hypothetical protein